MSERRDGTIHPIGHFAANAQQRAKQRSIEAVSHSRAHRSSSSRSNNQSRRHNANRVIVPNESAPTNQSTSQSVDQSDAQSTSESTTEPVNQTVEQPIEQAVYQSQPVTTAFDLSGEQESMIESFNELVESDELSNNQASLLRRFIVLPEYPANQTVKESIKQSLEQLSSKPDDRSPVTQLASQADELSAIESQCLELQFEEVQVLSSIFQSSELSISRSIPLIIRLIVRLESVECQLELNFMLDTMYPLNAPATVRSYIPPPFNDYLTQSSSQSVNQSSLQEVLEVCAASLVGECSVYQLIDRARQWVDEHEPILQHSLDNQLNIQAKHQQHRMLYQSISQPINASSTQETHVDIFGRGRIESEIDQLINQASNQLGCSRAQSKVALLEASWDLAKVKQPANQSANQFIGFDVESLIASLQAVDVSGERRCLSCMEDLCVREGVQLIDCLFDCSSDCLDVHFVCYPCYARYVSTILNTGSVYIRCPGTVMPSNDQRANNRPKPCPVYVDENVIFALLSVRDYSRYRRFLQDSFITLQRARWCVNPRCHFVARIQQSNSKPGSQLVNQPTNQSIIQSLPIVCHCNSVYCVDCGEAAHWPLQCSERALYYSSMAIQGLRSRHEQLAKIERELRDDTLIIAVKPCPKCKTKWERSEGCNHIKCAKCSHHYCFVCLGDWAVHGVAWYECQFAYREVKATSLVFQETDALCGTSDEVLQVLVGRECEATNNMTRAITVKANADGELPTLLTQIPGSTIDDLKSLLTTVIAAHALLQHVFIQLCQHKNQLNGSKVTLLVKKMFEQLSQTEFFLDIIDSAMLRFDLVRGVRQERTLAQLQDTERSVVKYGTLFLQSFKQFLEKEAKAPVFEDDDDEDSDAPASGAVKPSSAAAFFSHLDRLTGKARPKDDARFDIAPPITF